MNPEKNRPTDDPDPIPAHAWTILRLAAIQSAMEYGYLPAALHARYETAEAYLFRRLER